MNKTITIVDYEIGNLQSVKQAIEFWGANAEITSQPKSIANADYLLLPGVGAFGHGMEKLKQTGLDQAILDFGKRGNPFLGICLGMQLMFEKSYEFGEHQGLGLIEGEIQKIKGNNLKVPHIGWNQIRPINSEEFQTPLLKNITSNPYMYFAHSYYCKTKDLKQRKAFGQYYEIEILAVVQKDNFFGCQFHPEKSGKNGLDLLKNFIEL